MLLLLSCLTCAFSVSAAETINIGILSHRGDTRTATYWSDTATYLTQNIPDKEFKIVPLDFDEIEPNIMSKQIHFVLVNPGIYVLMEVRHRITRIATLSRNINGQDVNMFGGVIFTLKSRTDINDLDDIKDRSLMAVDATSFGGYQAALSEMILSGFDPENDLSSITFGGIHDNVVMSVLAGKADVGTVRTGILESMHANGLIDIDDFKILNEKSDEAFKEKHSTELYPEWPFSKLQHTSNRLAEKYCHPADEDA